MSNDDQSLLPDSSSPLARVGKSSRVIARGVEYLDRAAHRFSELPAKPGLRCKALAINNRGQIAGYIRWSDDATQAVVWELGRMTILETSPGMHSRAFDINSHGQVAGVEYLAEFGGDSDSLQESRAVLWDNGRRVLLDDGGGYLDSEAYSINDHGHIVGSFKDWRKPRSDEVKAVLWHNGLRTDLESLRIESFDRNDATEAVASVVPGHKVLEAFDGAYDINNQGVIVGSSHSRAVIWEDGQIRELDLTGCGYFPWESDARGINDHGQVVGTVWPNPYEPPDWNGSPQSYLWNERHLLNLASVAPHTEMRSPWLEAPTLKINNLGQIVGLQCSTYPNHACLWEGGRMVELSTPNAETSYATDLNDLGQVVGNYERRDGVWRACRWG